MKSIQIINGRQAAWLLGSLLTGGGLLSLQHELIRTSHMDAWFTYLFPALYVLVFGYVLVQLSMRFPNMHLFEIIFALFGRIIGTVVNLLLVVHLWVILMRDLLSSGKFIGTILLPQTPEEIIVLLFMILLMFYGRTSVEVIARVNDLFFPIFFPVGASAAVHAVQRAGPGIAATHFDGSSDPFMVFQYSGHRLVRRCLCHRRFYAHDVEHQAIPVQYSTWDLMAVLLLTIFQFLQVIVFGPNLPGNMIYPSYSLVQQIHITDFLDRVDLFILSIWFPVTACKVILIYLAFLTGVTSLLKKRDYTLLNSPLSLVLLMTTLLAFKNTTEVFSFGNYCSPVLVLAYQPVLLIASGCG